MTELAAVQIKQNVTRVQAQIDAACERAGRNADEVTLVAVSKKKPIADILAASDAGVQHFGENRVEESQEKIPQIDVPVTWHMVGHIQSRKARHIPPLFHIVHSVDSVKLAEKLSRQLTDEARPLDVLVQVNVSGEAQKYGFEAFRWRDDRAIRGHLWSELEQIFALPNLNVRGLMTLAPLVEDIEQTRPVFTELALLRDALTDAFDITLPDLSMGMTDDYPVAIEEGATIVRIGRAIFGEREG